MKIKNLNILEAQLRWLGFGAVLSISPHRERIAELEDGNFTVSVTEDFDGMGYMKSILYFTRLPQTELYEFVKFSSGINLNGDPSLVRIQTFPVTSAGITHKEAFNLLSGRSVYKAVGVLDEESANVWVRLDFKQQLPDGNYKMVEYSFVYGYEVERLVQQFPIEELKSEALRQNLILSLKKGNQHPVTFVLQRRKVKKFIEACPERKCIVIRNPELPKQGKAERISEGDGLRN